MVMMMMTMIEMMMVMMMIMIIIMIVMILFTSKPFNDIFFIIFIMNFSYLSIYLSDIFHAVNRPKTIITSRSYLRDNVVRNSVSTTIGWH